MTIDNDVERVFLIELYNTTQGDLSLKTTMQAVGAAVGLDKDESGKTAEELIGKGYVEIKTLSGGIGITTEGIEAARRAGAGAGDESAVTLSAGPFITDEDRLAVETILKEIKGAAAKFPSDYDRLEELVVDIKTIEVHLLSPRPKTAVIREVLRALAEELDRTEADAVAGRISSLIG